MVILEIFSPCRILAPRVDCHSMPSLGETIKHLRLAREWTLDTLSKASGVSKGFLSELENGKRSNLGSATLMKIADAFKVPVESLMEGGLQIPADLAQFASAQNLTFSDAVTLLKMRRQIHAHRDAIRSEDDAFDWRQFYDAVKPFLK